MGLEQTGRITAWWCIRRIRTSSLVCALGHAYGPQPERGVFRTTDGGQTWAKTLFVDENTGCSDIAMDPKNPRILFAGMWTARNPHVGPRERRAGERPVHVARRRRHLDAAARAAACRRGRSARWRWRSPRRIPNRVYALIETGDGVPWKGQPTDRGQLWRSDNGGDTWQVVSYDHNAMGRAHYYSRMAVAPDDEDEAYFLTASYSQDDRRRPDHHGHCSAPRRRAAIITTSGSIRPTPNRQIVAHDQGLSITINRGKTWYRQRLKNAQIYHVTVDNEIPYNVLGNKQDEPTYRGPSNSRLQAGFGGDPGIPRAMWHAVGGGESGWATPDPTDSNIVWSTASGSGMVGGIVVRFEESRRQFRSVEVWPDQSNGPAEGVRYRFVWDAPLQISPHDHNTIYVGSQHVHRTTNGGQSWEVISPDLTLNDRSRMGSSGGLTPDNIGVEYAGVVYGIAESPREKRR